MTECAKNAMMLDEETPKCSDIPKEFGQGRTLSSTLLKAFTNDLITAIYAAK